MTAPATRLASQRFVPVAVFLLHATLFGVLTAWSWRKWPDPLIDFGRELYVPWQLTQGQVLFRDVESMFGPLSPYMNALWMRLFGTSLLTIALCNLALFAAIVAGVHRVVRVSTDRFTASAASLAVLLLCGFLQLRTTGNYNFVTPYAHEATHGIAFSVALVLVWHAALTSGRLRFGAIAGVLFGAVLLTKPEIILAASAATGTAAVAALACRLTSLRRLRRLLMSFAAAALVPSLLFFGYFRQHMTVMDAFDGTLGAISTTLDAQITTSAFYLSGMGLDQPVMNALRMLLAFAAFVAFIAIAVLLSSPGRWQPPETVKQVFGAVLPASALLVLPLDIARALPLIVLGAAAAIGLELRRAARDSAASGKLVLLLAWSVFALALLAKLGLYARVQHYGFSLALPAVTVVVVVLCWLIPSWLASRQSPAVGRHFRRIAATALAIASVPFLMLSNVAYQAKTRAIGAGGDRFYATGDAGTRAAAEALDVIRSLAAPGDTLAVLPEGVMLNYLARLESPLRVVNFMPPELAVFGEDEVLGSIERNRPRFFVLVHKNVEEYGYPPFGSDAKYGYRTLRWVREHYRLVQTFGHRAWEPAGDGLALFERVDPT